MAKVIIYTTSWCPYCVKAKALLDKLGQSYDEINIEEDETKRDEMMEKANGARSVPQIFIDDRHVGGCDDLHALHQKGELEPLLK